MLFYREIIFRIIILFSTYLRNDYECGEEILHTQLQLNLQKNTLSILNVQGHEVVL